MEESMKRETLVRWGAAFLVPVLILCLPSGEVFTPVLKKFLSVTVFGLLLMALELAPSMCSAIIFPIGYVLFDVAPIQTVLAPWIGTTALVIVCGFWLAMILLRTGLLDRVICRCAIFFRRLLHRHSRIHISCGRHRFVRHLRRASHADSGLCLRRLQNA